MKTDKEYVFALGDLIQWLRFQANWDEIEDWDGEVEDFMYEIEVKTPEDITDSDIRYLLDTVNMTNHDTHAQRNVRILESYLAAETSPLPSYVSSDGIGWEDALSELKCWCKMQLHDGNFDDFFGLAEYFLYEDIDVRYSIARATEATLYYASKCKLDDFAKSKVEILESYLAAETSTLHPYVGSEDGLKDKSQDPKFHGIIDWQRMIVNCPPQHSKTFITSSTGAWRNSGIGYSALASNHDWQFLKLPEQYAPKFEDPMKVDRFQCHVQDYALKAHDLCNLSAEEVKQIDDLMHRHMLEELYRMEDDSIMGIDRGKSNDYNESTTRKEDKDMEFTQTAEASLSATIFTEKARVLIVQGTSMSGSLHNQSVDLSAEIIEQSLESIVKSGGKKTVLIDTESVSKILKEYLLLKEFYRDSRPKMKPSLKEKAKSLVNKASWASVGAATALGYLLL